MYPDAPRYIPKKTMPLNLPQRDESQWGRAAMGRYFKTQEEIQADIIKSLESKLSAEFQDYSQWQRISFPKPQPSLAVAKSIKKTPKKVSRPVTGASGTSCSSLCLHLRDRKPPPVDPAVEAEAKERVSLLNYQIRAAERSLNQYKQLCENLETKNKELKSETENSFSDTQRAVTELLESYERYCSVSKTIRSQHVETRSQMENQVQFSQEQLSEETEKLKQEVKTLDNQLRDLQQDLQVLSTYKDKDYPVKAMQISKLQDNVAELSADQNTEEIDLIRIISDQRMKLLCKRGIMMTDILNNVADDAFESMVPPGLQHLAWHNTVIEHEIEERKEEIDCLEKEIIVLQSEIYELRRKPQARTRTFVFPECYFRNTICQPDEDVILDIPVREPLPI